MSDTDAFELTSTARKSAIAAEIWGPSSTLEAEQNRVAMLESFFQCYQDEQESEEIDHTEVLAAIRILKRRPETKRVDLHSSDRASAASDETTDVFMLELAVRSMFLAACTHRTRHGTESLSTQTVFRPRWKDSESLTTYLGRVFPVSQPPQQDLLGFRIGKLRISYLETYASVAIEWTNHLSDHLVLLRGETWKKLYIFRHPSFLKVSLERMRMNDEEMGQSDVEALRLGCLPPGLLKETLLTMNLLFPIIGDSVSRTVLEREVRRHNLDPYLLDHFYLDMRDHESPRDALEPRDIRGLYEKYPYWADRLYDLWREADDPTPITRIERWTEARKNPRFTYWCAVVSIMLAIMFGLLATGLAAIQVWISWCDWLDDPSLSQCGYKNVTSKGRS